LLYFIYLSFWDYLSSDPKKTLDIQKG